MNAPVNRNLIETASTGSASAAPSAPARRPRWLLIGATVLLFLLALLGLVVWLLRRTLTENAVERWCTTQGLTCTGTAERVGPRAVRLTQVDVRRGETEAFAADAIEARLTWRSPFSPSPSLIIVDRPVLRGRMDETGLTFSGLEKLLDRPSSGAAPPEIDIRDGRLLLDTPVGPVAATAQVKGRFPQSGTIEAAFDPGALKGPQGEGDLQAATLSLKAEDGVLKGMAKAAGTLKAGDDAKLEGAIFDVSLAVPLDKTQPLELGWTGKAVSLTSKALYAEKVESAGEVNFATRPSGGLDAILDALTRGETETRAAFVKSGARTFETVSLKASATRKDGALRGPLSVQAGGVSMAELSARGFSAKGDFVAAKDIGFEGESTLTGARLGETQREQIVRAFALPPLLSAHQAEGRTILNQALTDFSLTAPVSFVRKGDDLRFAATGETRFTAASGLTVTLTPTDEGENLPVFALDGKSQRLEATIDARGGGLPDVKLEAATLLLQKGAFDLAAAGATLGDWRAGEQSVGGTTGPITVRLEGGALEAETTGTLRAAGKFAGLAFKPTDIAFAIATTRQAGRWQARSPDGSCFNVTSEGFDFGTVSAGAFSAKACGEGGYLLDPKSRTPRGVYALDAIDLPFAANNASGRLQLSDSALVFTGGAQTTLEVTGKTLGLPMNFGTRSFALQSQAPQLAIVTGSGAPEVKMTLGQTEFSGTMVPAQVMAAGLVFDGRAPASGLEGKLDATRIRIADNRADPLYQPLLSDFSGSLSEDRLKGRAPLRLAASGTPIGTADVDLDYLKLNGTIGVETGKLDFVSGGLQPVMLTEQLRGVFTDATGTLKARADLTVTKGEMAGTADVSLDDFGFQTQRLGRVEDVDGAVRFSDVFKLTTEKNQRVTIGAMKPGVPLEDGEIYFGLTDGKTVRVAGAMFPFAGGRIELGPIDWVIGNRNQQAEVKVINIDLSSLVETLKIPDIQATGTLSGAFPIRIEGQKLLVDKAKLLTSDAGGRFIYEGKALDNVANSPELQMANGALKNLQYEVIELGLDGDIAGKMALSARILGSNANAVQAGPRMELQPGQAFDFSVRYATEGGGLISLVNPNFAFDQYVDGRREDDDPPPEAE